jgi:hypothetical protein
MEASSLDMATDGPDLAGAGQQAGTGSRDAPFNIDSPSRRGKFTFYVISCYYEPAETEKIWFQESPESTVRGLKYTLQTKVARHFHDFSDERMTLELRVPMEPEVVLKDGTRTLRSYGV